jgi:NAD(P)H-flavin reductase
VKEDELKAHAHRLAHARPDRSPGAERPRERFAVERVWPEGSRYIALSVRLDDGEFLASHRRPGQYTTFQYGGLKPRFLAIASAPNPRDAADPRWEFLIDRGSAIGKHIAEKNRIEAGRKVLLSPAEGRGYPVEALDGRPVLLFSTGAGIASVRPAMQHWGANPDAAPSDIALYYGERDPRHFAYADELADWRARGVRVYQAIENLDAESDDGLNDDSDDADLSPENLDRAGGYRYVQHAFDADAPDLEDAAIFVSGAPIMMEIVIEKLLRMGVEPDRIHINV